jgi:hypothetical protein
LQIYGAADSARKSGGFGWGEVDAGLGGVLLEDEIRHLSLTSNSNLDLELTQAAAKEDRRPTTSSPLHLYTAKTFSHFHSKISLLY